MATMFPDIKRMPMVFLSSAEERVYQLAKSLPDAWRVYYSVTLSMKEQDSGIKDGEIDFVFYHPRHGVIVVEVKGGRISLDGSSGQFYSENRSGRSFAIRNPFQQAISFRNRFVRFLRSQDIQVPISHAVCFPQVDESEFPPHANIEPATLLGRTRLADLEKSLAEIARSFHSEDFLEFKDAATSLDDVLVGATFKSKPMLREYIDSEEARVIESDGLHDNLVMPLVGVTRLGVEGEAGTGKSLLAVNLANHFANEQKSVLVLASSPLLVSHLRNSLASNVTMMTFQELAGSFGLNLLVAPSDGAVSGDQWIQYDAPERLRHKITESELRYDVILVDEAQDVQPFWWVAFETLLREKDQSKLYVFFDRDQGVFGGGEGASSFTPEDSLPVPTNYVRLTKNYRNTSEISQLANEFKRTKAALTVTMSDRVGYHPSVVAYDDALNAVDQLSQLLKRLIHEQGMRSDEIVILSARAPESKESILSGVAEIAGLKVIRLTPQGVAQGKYSSPGEIGVATVAAFKGLEAKVVIVVNLCEHKMSLDNPIMASLTYVALTRAKHMLYVMVKEGDPKADKIRAAHVKIRSQGAIVIAADERPGEFTGRILHLNPERMGVIEMQTGDEALRNIIMLPQDIPASSLPGFRKDQMVRFRIRSEGGVATAIGLSLLA
jgi:hypothetical protein